MTFRKGASGNPRGRPRGVQTQAKLREAIAEGIPRILKAMQDKAEAGDTQAARLLLDRTIPPLKPADTAAQLRLSADSADLGSAAQALLGALVAGTLTPDQSSSIAAVLGALARIKETAELEGRIAALEIRATTTPEATNR